MKFQPGDRVSRTMGEKDVTLTQYGTVTGVTYAYALVLWDGGTKDYAYPIDRLTKEAR